MIHSRRTSGHPGNWKGPYPLTSVCTSRTSPDLSDPGSSISMNLRDTQRVHRSAPEPSGQAQPDYHHYCPGRPDARCHVVSCSPGWHGPGQLIAGISCQCLSIMGSTGRSAGRRALCFLWRPPCVFGFARGFRNMLYLGPEPVITWNLPL